MTIKNNYTFFPLKKRVNRKKNANFLFFRILFIILYLINVSSSILESKLNIIKLIYKKRLQNKMFKANKFLTLFFCIFD